MDDKTKNPTIASIRKSSWLCKADVKPPSGFSAIPKSTRGGFRKKSGGGYVYWYPDGKGSVSKPKEGDTADKKTKKEVGATKPPEPVEQEVPDELKDLYEDKEKVKQAAKTELQRHQIENDRQRMQTVLDMLTSLVPGISEEESAKIRSSVAAKYGRPEYAPADQQVEQQEEVEQTPVEKSLRALVSDLLYKGRATKYCRREPTGKPKRPWRYYYGDDCGSSAARGSKVGDEVKIGKQTVRILAVSDDGTLTVEGVDSDFFALPGEHTIEADSWSSLLTHEYGKAYQKSAERRSRQAINAVIRLVPPSLLKELKGDTEKERLADLKKRAPEVYARLQQAFVRAGVDLIQARGFVADTLRQKDWNVDARAALLGNLLDKKNAWLARNFRSVLAAVNNSRTEQESDVTVGHVQAAIEILRPRGPADNIDKISDALIGKLSDLQKKLREGDSAADVLRAMLADPAVAKLMAVTQAVPSLVTPASTVAKEITNEIQANAIRPPSKRGASTQVMVAGANGAPVSVPGHYQLMEAHEAIPSHDSESFGKHKKYPAGLQERAYHRDKAEQRKVQRNAQRQKPIFLVNTNPDALNGPPIMNQDHIVLGGNSRTMSMQRVYKHHPENAAAYKEYLADNAHQMGFTPADLDDMKEPILVRVVDTAGHDEHLLVRQMNESFIQQMDPRTMQVAMGRRLGAKAIAELGSSMRPDETLRAFLDDNRAKQFVSSLSDAGIIDTRNESQYLKKNGKLNEDGKRLVERVLVGHLIDDPDLLSNTRASMVGSIARSVPLILQAEAVDKKYNIRENIKQALDGHTRMHDMGFGAKLGATASQKAVAAKEARGQMTDLFEGEHPVLTDERTGLLFDAFVKYGGPRQLSRVFADYATNAKNAPEGQTMLLGPEVTPVSVLRGALQNVESRDKRDERLSASVGSPQQEAMAMSLFAGQRRRLSDMRMKKERSQ